MKQRIIMFNPGTEGGIPMYTHFLARAFSELEWHVVVLCDRKSPFGSWPEVESIDILLADPKDFRRTGSAHILRPARLLRLLGIAYRILANQFHLFVQVLRLRPDIVLLSSYAEYLAPVWSPGQWLLSKFTKTRFMAVLHDPVRDFRVGPEWWHFLSVRMAFWPLSAVFVHDLLPPEANVPKRIRSAVVPHGLFGNPHLGLSSQAIRHEWNVPDDAVVFLSLGFIRDGKNLDLVINAMVKNPSVYLVIMGRVQSAANNKPISYYKNLVNRLMVADRVRFRIGFVPDEMLSSSFSAADVIVMTYSQDFRSQSGVLNAAAYAEKPLLISCGEGPLKNCALRFQLGVSVVPDSQEAVDDGMRVAYSLATRLKLGGPMEHADPCLDWAGYREFASWKTNAKVITATYEAIAAGAESSVPT